VSAHGLTATTEKERLGENIVTLLGLETATGAMKSLVSDFEVKDCRRCFGERMNFISSEVELIHQFSGCLSDIR